MVAQVGECILECLDGAEIRRVPLDEQIVLNAGLAIEERAGFTARPEKWW